MENEHFFHKIMSVRPTKIMNNLIKVSKFAGVNIVFESREVPPGLVFSKLDLFLLSFT